MHKHSSDTGDPCGGLTFEQQRFLSYCYNAATTDRKTLAKRLGISQGAIHARFKRIGATLETHGAAEAVLYYIRYCADTDLLLREDASRKKRLAANKDEQNVPDLGFPQKRGLLYNSVMLKNIDTDAFIDQVAQAVIDRIEERDRVAGLVELVVQRVLQLQKENREEDALLAATRPGDTTSLDATESVNEKKE